MTVRGVRCRPRGLRRRSGRDRGRRRRACRSPSVSMSAPAQARRSARRIGIRGADQRAVVGEVIDGPAGDEPALVDDDDVVDEVLHLGEEVAGDEHGVAPCGSSPEQVAQIVDALAGRGRWRVRRAPARPGRRAAPRRARAAASCPASRCRPGGGRVRCRGRPRRGPRRRGRSGDRMPAATMRRWLRPDRPGWKALGSSMTPTVLAGLGRSRYRDPPMVAVP